MANILLCCSASVSVYKACDLASKLAQAGHTVRTALTAVNLSIPITQRRLALGTWQGVYLWEHRHHDHHRKVTVHLLGE